MNEQLSQTREQAEAALATSFHAVRDGLPGGATTRDLRDRAFARFAATGLPHRRMEDWKYTDLRRLMRTVADPAGAADAQVLKALAADDPLADVPRSRIVVANGRYRADLSTIDTNDGLNVEDLADVLAAAPERAGELLGDDPIVALNTAFLQGGVVITVAAHAVIGEPVEIAHLAALTAPGALAPRIVVRVGDNAAVTFVESYRGPDGLAYQVNAVSELHVGSGAHTTWVRLQSEGRDAQHLCSFFACLDRKARLNHLAVNGGAALWRWQGRALVAGEGADAGFSGATLLTDRGHGDIKLTVTHEKGHSASREVFKTVLDGRAEGAFQGLIEVNRNAQKTDARMMTQALLLSDDAQFASKPELEIFADDVQCGHGSTTGQIDETQLFYLMTRGLPRADASRLLIEAFLDDPIDTLGESTLADALRRTVSTWLARMDGAEATA